MLLSHIKRLCTILPSLIAADSTGTNSLPAQLQRTVPACAQPCLQSALQIRFPSCTFQKDLQCLCSLYSEGGEALGEVALQCVYTFCSNNNEAADTYNVCFGQEGAVLPTKTVIVVPIKTTSSRAFVTTWISSTFTTTITTTSIHSPATTSRSVIVNSNSFPSSITSSSLPTATPTVLPVVTAPPRGPETMKPAQIAGLSVAAAATFIVAIGLMALSVFLRRRKERKTCAEKGEKKPQLPKSYSSRPYSQFPLRGSSPRIPSPRFPPLSELSAHKSVKGDRPIRPIPQLDSTAYAIPPPPSPPKTYSPDYTSVHPLLRPAASSRNSSNNSSVPLDQIGLAFSNTLPGKSVKPGFLKRPPKAELRQQRPKSLRRSLKMTNRASRASVMTQETIFEEDLLPTRRRSSMLLPTPPMPIPPIRILKPSRQSPTPNATGKPQKSVEIRQQIPQQPELSLNIPVRQSRTMPPRFALVGVPSSRGSPKPDTRPQLGPPIQMTSAYGAYKPTATAVSTPESSHLGDIPDYYFTSHQNTRKPKSNKYPTPKSTLDVIQSQPSPKLMISARPKRSTSTMSRATSRASTTFRDSISSQTSFETTGTNDPTPEDEDEDKQLSSSDENKLSPVAESPISNLRYPKVPRASNQLVPRSPRSPQNHNAQNQSSPRLLPTPSALLIKRRGEREALQLERQLHMDSPKRSDLREHVKQMDRNHAHIRSNSVIESWDAGPSALSERLALSGRSTRTQSGQWPKSPAMYEIDVVKPLNVRPRKQSVVGVNAGQLMSPGWVPHLTPTRFGEDLMISVSYSKGGR
ncbi:hypothetical protein K504DRAFT_86070 [Pleomassaria siparia CBS 279.74]|uniref:CFEM domain-containing protein n=1 Tax=Pleomassaria siparia CBS 279.74 TaxID=1314801 RepID=A0A6G1JZ57_9PLEO|nr:hypothetical protein K504DRAFT_86070 [Pleomassaria siparia CBS 279.74]